jgi:hypothetical protein
MREPGELELVFFSWQKDTRKSLDVAIFRAFGMKEMSTPTFTRPS